MQVKFLSGPRAGDTAHLPPLEARALIAGGFAEEIKHLNFIDRMRAENPPAAPEMPKWSVELFGNLEKKISIVMRLGATTVAYQGRPEDVNAKREWPGGFKFLSGFGRIVPDGVAAAYKKAYKNAQPGQRLHIEAPEPDPANTRMSEELSLAQRQAREKEAGMRQAGLTTPAFAGGDDGEVLYEKSDPGFN